MKRLKSKEYHQSLGMLIDVGDELTYYDNHLPGSINIPQDKLLLNHKTILNKSLPYYITCRKGFKSRRVVNILEFYGYNVTQVYTE